jgi:hypothetical protein
VEKAPTFESLLWDKLTHQNKSAIEIRREFI